MEKGELRTEMKHAPPPSTAINELVVRGLFEYLSPRLPATAASYLAIRAEVDIATLVNSLPGWRWVLPRVEPDGSLTFRDISVELELHDLGMRQPISAGQEVSVLEIDVILVPGLAFDRSGARLGRGGGHYDRVLQMRRSDCSAVGVTTEQRVVEVVPTDTHDERVDFLATERGVSPCSPTM